MEDRNCAEDITMWTAQDKRVIDTIREKGEYVVKWAYIQEKYQEAAWIFRTAYSFFVKQAEKIIERPFEADSPVWVFADPRWAVPGENADLLKLRIPMDQVVCFDMQKWQRILNLSYLGEEKEQEDFEMNLRRQGILSMSEVFEKPYYPALRKEIMDSWIKLFDGQMTDSLYTQGAVWKIRQEWIV